MPRDLDYAWTEDIDFEDAISWNEAEHPRVGGGSPAGGEFTAGGGGSKSYGQSYVRASETGEQAPQGGGKQAGAVAKAAKGAVKLAGKGASMATNFVAEDYQILHHAFKNAKPADRSKVGGHLKAMAKALPELLKAHVHEEKQHAIHAAGALKSLVTGSRPSRAQLQGLRSFATRALMVSASVALGDPTGSLGHLAGAFGQDIVQHVVVEHAIKLFVGGGAGAVRGALASPQADAAPTAEAELGDDDVKLLQKFLEALGEAVETMTEADAHKILTQTQQDPGDAEDEADGDADDQQEEDGGDEEGGDEAGQGVDERRPAEGDDVDYTSDEAVDPDWDESKHKRVSGGREEGGQFTSTGGGTPVKGHAKRLETAKTAAAAGKPVKAAPAKPAAAVTPTEQQQARTAAEPNAISTRIPSDKRQKDTGINAHATAQHVVDWQAAKNPEAADWMKSASDILTGKAPYPDSSFRGKTPEATAKKKAAHVNLGIPPGPADEDPQAAAERFIKFAAGNIMAIYNAVPEAWRDKASHWYDGANKIANRWSQEYGYSPPQMAGALAALSPKKDWFQNVALVQRMLDIRRDHQKTQLTPKAGALLEQMIATKLAKTKAKYENITGKQQKTLTGAETTPVPQDPKAAALHAKEVAKRKQSLEKTQATAADELAEIQGILDGIRNPDGSWKALGELSDPVAQAAWINVYDLAEGSPNYREVTPDGEYGEIALNKGEEAEDEVEPEAASEGKKATRGRAAKEAVLGSPKTRVWQTWDNMAKAVRILDDKSADPTETISRNTGDAHKVRNFYMNILYPNSKGGHITVDTHAIAGALLRPLGQNDPEVLVGLGNSSPSNNTHGLGGTYPMFAEAYRQAAAQASAEAGHEILPRQMQSIVWEGLRGLFSPEAKRSKTLRADVDAQWAAHMRGEQDEATTRGNIMFRANPEGKGVPRTPSWY